MLERSTQDVKAAFNYGPYGEDKGTDKATVDWDSRLKFQMAPKDPMTGSYTIGPRVMDPGINRFVGADMYVGAAANLGLQVDPLTGNRYLYAGANPIGMIDDGHAVIAGSSAARAFHWLIWGTTAIALEREAERQNGTVFPSRSKSRSSNGPPPYTARAEGGVGGSAPGFSRAPSRTPYLGGPIPVEQGNGYTITYEDPLAGFGQSTLFNKKISPQAQSRHVHGTEEWADNEGGYFESFDDAQTVLDAYHSGEAEIITVKRNGNVLVEYPNVTGYNNNPRKGFMNQPTHRFVIKGEKMTSLFPTSPTATR